MKINGHDYTATISKVLENWYLKFAEFTPKLLVGALVFSFFLISSRYLSKIALKLFQKFFPKSKAEASLNTYLSIFRFLILVMGTFITLEIMGLSGFLWKFIGSLGVAGIIAGVALQDLASSIFSGMLVGMDKSFKIGDYVTIDTISGTVDEIGLLTTKVIGDDGKKNFIPNQLIFSAPFVNVSASENRRITLSLEIPNTEDLIKIESIIKDEVTKIDGANVSEIQPQIVVTRQSLGIYYLEVRFWLQKGSNILQVQTKAYMQVKKRLDSEGISTVNPLQNITAQQNPTS